MIKLVPNKDRESIEILERYKLHKPEISFFNKLTNLVKEPLKYLAISTGILLITYLSFRNSDSIINFINPPKSDFLSSTEMANNCNVTTHNLTKFPITFQLKRNITADKDNIYSFLCDPEISKHIIFIGETSITDVRVSLVMKEIREQLYKDDPIPTIYMDGTSNLQERFTAFYTKFAPEKLEVFNNQLADFQRSSARAKRVGDNSKNYNLLNFSSLLEVYSKCSDDEKKLILDEYNDLLQISEDKYTITAGLESDVDNTQGMKKGYIFVISIDPNFYPEFYRNRNGRYNVTGEDLQPITDGNLSEYKLTIDPKDPKVIAWIISHEFSHKIGGPDEALTDEIAENYLSTIGDNGGLFRLGVGNNWLNF